MTNMRRLLDLKQSGTLLDGVLPMLDADGATEERLTVICDDDAVIDPDAAIGQPVDRRLDADAGDDEVALEALAGFRILAETPARLVRRG